MIPEHFLAELIDRVSRTDEKTYEKIREELFSEHFDDARLSSVADLLADKNIDHISS